MLELNGLLCQPSRGWPCYPAPAYEQYGEYRNLHLMLISTVLGRPTFGKVSWIICYFPYRIDPVFLSAGGACVGEHFLLLLRSYKPTDFSTGGRRISRKPGREWMNGCVPLDKTILLSESPLTDAHFSLVYYT